MEVKLDKPEYLDDNPVITHEEVKTLFTEQEYKLYIEARMIKYLFEIYETEKWKTDLQV